MHKLVGSVPDIQVVITRADLVQFLYPIRCDLARLDRRLESIENTLDRISPRGRAQIVRLHRSRSRR